MIRVNLGHPMDHHLDNGLRCLIISPNQLSYLVGLEESYSLHVDAVCISCELAIPESFHVVAMAALTSGGVVQAVSVRNPRPIIWMNFAVAKRWSVELLESYWRDDIEHVIDRVMSDSAYSSIELSKTICPDLDSGSPIPSARVLFFSPFGSWLVHNQVDAVLATALRLRGADVLIVRCDGLFGESCYVLVHSQDKALDCKNCRETGDSFFTAFSLPTTQIREHTPDNRRAEITELVASIGVGDIPHYIHDHYPVGIATTHHICSYFRITTRELPTERVVKVHRAMLVNSILAYEGTRAICTLWNPTQLVMFNGSGFAHGAAFYAGKNLGISVLAHERGLSDDSFLMVDSAICVNPGPQIHVGNEWRKVPLLPDEFTRTIEFIENRERGKDMNLYPFYQFQTAQLKVREVLRIPQGAKIVSAFTSSEYETIYWPEFRKAERQLELLDTLIEIFRGRPEYLVIRHHPAIGGYAGTSPQYDLLYRLYEQITNLPSNVRIIMPNEQLTSYALLWNSEACITAISTLATEATARGIPAAVMDISPHRLGVAEVMFELSRNELERIVDSLLSRSRQDRCDDLKRCLRSVNGMYFRYCNRFSSFGVDPATFGHSIRVSSVEQLAEGCDQTLDRVCKHIMFGTSVYDLPGREEFERDENEERNLVNEYFEKSEKFRLTIIESSPSNKELSHIMIFLPGQQNGKSPLNGSLASQRLGGSKVSVLPSRLRIAADIKSAVRQTDAELVFFPSPLVLYDTAFLSTSQDLLLEDSSLTGILWAAWVQEQERIDSCIFGKVSILESVANLESRGLRVAEALSLCIFRRSFVAAWADSVSDSTDIAVLMEHCWGSERFWMGDIPLAVMHCL
jgi:hypothetical protein